ncbi:hypothetical protein [Azospirillum argentinense]|uniref:Uncharacterized protein n=1 Tax=Azospirillum brasilense TaxID=192 RepID=A0A4D8QAU2_AZOBR|nr:hypothetical protein [Azospirillum argentinense]QCO07505.1 hypothetical protein D3867_37105 [Azospirillum argentinense]
MPRDHETRPVGELRLLVLARLLDAVGSRFPERLSVGRLHELGLTIEQAAVQALIRTDKTFSGATINDMTRHMLHKRQRWSRTSSGGPTRPSSARWRSGSWPRRSHG